MTPANDKGSAPQGAEPTPQQMHALLRALESRKGIRQILDEIREDNADFEPPLDPDSDLWTVREVPIIVEILHEAVKAVLDA